MSPDDPRVIRARERLGEIVRDPRTRARLEEIATNSRNKRTRAEARKLLKRLDTELAPVTETEALPRNEANFTELLAEVPPHRARATLGDEGGR